MTQEPGRSAKYQKIASDLRDRIVSGEYLTGAQLPTKAALREQWHVAEGTVDKALDVLRDEGRVETVHGSGTFVRDPGPRHSPEYGVIVARLEKAEKRLEVTRRDVERLYVLIGRPQPSQQQGSSNGKDRHERTG